MADSDQTWWTSLDTDVWTAALSDDRPAAVSDEGRGSGPVRRHAAARVLLVDDNQFDRIAIGHLLSGSGAAFEVISARDSEEALSVLREQSFDCLLVDVHLPRESGIDLMHRALHQFGKNCPPVVLMTASSGRDTGVIALKGGADDFLNKDELNAEVLQSTVLEAIKKRRIEQAKERHELESRMRSLGQLAAGIAHELNNPAAYVRVNLDLLEEQLTAATTGEHKGPTQSELAHQLRLVRECSEGLDRMASIVSELQSFTNSDSSRSEPVVLDDAVRSSSRFLAARLRTVGQANFELSGPPAVMANRRRLVQVIVNLLTNAIDAASETDPQIRVTTAMTDGNGVELCVEDNGGGIPLQLRERVFEPFFTTKGPGRGTGLGLSLCAEYVSQAGGTLDVDDSPLGGARFRVRLPVATRRSATVPPPSVLGRRSTDRKSTILAVDDEPSIRRAYARVLGSRYQVYTAANGRQALDVIRKHDIDAVICDLAMPGMGGRSLLEAIEKQWPDLARHVIFCTGGDLSGKSLGWNGQKNRVLNKPVSKTLLEEAIEELLSPDAGLS